MKQVLSTQKQNRLTTENDIPNSECWIECCCENDIPNSECCFLRFSGNGTIDFREWKQNLKVTFPTVMSWDTINQTVMKTTRRGVFPNALILLKQGYACKHVQCKHESNMYSLENINVGILWVTVISSEKKHSESTPYTATCFTTSHVKT